MKTIPSGFLGAGDGLFGGVSDEVEEYPDGDRTQEEYFYVLKTLDHPFKNAEEVVKGPLTKADFGTLKGELGLPDWSKRF